MDYKYIEQLIERYWEAQTTEAEERILRNFFAQEDIPEHLRRYAPIFSYQNAEASKDRLGADFDERVMARAEACQPATHVVKVAHITWSARFRPLFRAAATVAIVVLVAGAAQHALNQPKEPEGWDYNSAAYTDTYQDPHAAFNGSVEALKMVQEGLKMAAADSTKAEQQPATEETE